MTRGNEGVAAWHTGVQMIIRFPFSVWLFCLSWIVFVGVLVSLGCLDTMSYGIRWFVFGKVNPQESHLLMFPEMKTTLNVLSFCQISLYSLAELTLGTVETHHMKDYFLFGLVTALSCLFALFPWDIPVYYSVCQGNQICCFDEVPSKFT